MVVVVVVVGVEGGGQSSGGGESSCAVNVDISQISSNFGLSLGNT